MLSGKHVQVYEVEGDQVLLLHESRLPVAYGQLVHWLGYTWRVLGDCAVPGTTCRITMLDAWGITAVGSPKLGGFHG